MAPSLLDRPGLDTWLARLLFQEQRVEVELLREALDEARSGEETLARLLVARGAAPADVLETAVRSLLRSGQSDARRLGPFLLREQLGAGGMGVVWRAEHVETGAIYAIKTLNASSDPEFQLRFLREGQAQARVDTHPNVVRVHSAGREGALLYLVLDLAAGGDLQERLRSGALPPEEAARIARDLARGLAHVHAAGVLHRDLKPANVIFDAAGTPKLVDFGLARLEGLDSLTESGVILGTPSYMAPEQVRADRDALGPATDVYGLGALLYHLLSGRPPFRGGSVLVTLDQVLRQAPPPLSEVPAPLSAICLRCVEKSPGDRFASAGELADALEAYLRGERAPNRAPRSLAVLVASSLIVAGAALGWTFSEGSDRPPREPDWIRQGEAALAASKPREALRHYTRALELDPQSIVAREGRGRARLRLQLAAALEDLDPVLRAGRAPDLAREVAGLWAERAQRLVAEADVPAAKRAWRRVLELDPTSAARLELGWVELRLGRLTEAERIADELLAEDPSSGLALLLRGSVRRRLSSQRPLAMADLKKASERLPKSASVRTQLALYFLDGPKPDRLKAIASADAAMKLDAKNALGQALRAELLLKDDEKLREAQAVLDAAGDPGACGRLWYARALLRVTRLKSGRGKRLTKAEWGEQWREIKPLLASALAVDQADLAANALLGELCLSLGAYREADRHLTRALEGLGRRSLRGMRATSRRAFKDLHGALQDYRSLCSGTRQGSLRLSSSHLSHCVSLLRELGRLEEALEILNRALERDSRNAEAGLLRANLLLEQGLLKEAGAALQSIPEDQLDAGRRKVLAVHRENLERMQGSKDEARRHYENALEEERGSRPTRAYGEIAMATDLDPTHAEWWALRAVLAQGRERPERVAYACTRALELGGDPPPKRTDLLQARARAYLDFGDHRGVVSDVKSALELAPNRHELLLLGAEAHEALGDGAAARADLEAFLSKTPSTHGRRSEVERRLQELGSE